MKELEKRLQKIRKNLEKCHQYKRVEDMTTDELAQVITGNPNTKADDLSNEQLETIIREARK
jgi:hypothetical protein